jgi:hypothetical protein
MFVEPNPREYIMTEQQDKHPKRCETCENAGSVDCPMENEMIISSFAHQRDLMYDVTAKIGCASHSSRVPTCVTEGQEPVSLYKGCTECGDKSVCTGKCFHFIQLPVKALEEHDREIEKAAREDGQNKWHSERIRDLEELISLSDKLLHQFPDDFSLKLSKEQASRELKRLESLRSATSEPVKGNKS